MQKTFLILGGTGNTGLKIAEFLLKYTDSKVILAARNVDKIEVAVKQFQDTYASYKISGITADATDKRSLIKAFKNIDMVIVASGTAKFVNIVAQAAMDAKVDYLDIQYSTEKIQILKHLEDGIKKSKSLFITDAGFHPGLPAALIRRSALEIEQVKTANIYSVIQQDWKSLNLSLETKVEFVRELANYDPRFLENGKWKRASMMTTRDFKKIDFGEPIGLKTCTPMNFEELKGVPKEIPSLQNSGFYITGFNWFVDMVLMPIGFVWVKVFKNFGLKSISKMMFRSLERNSKPPFVTILKLKSSGNENGKHIDFSIELSHKDGYWFTAIPVVACLQQYIKGDLPSSGLWCMGNVVQPKELLKDMAKMGIKIKEKKNER